MRFDDWMLTKDKSYVPTDDSMPLRLLRECWFSRDVEVAELKQTCIDHVEIQNSLRHQLSDHIKREVMLRDALSRLWNERTPDSLDEAGEALADTADTSGLILCHAKPVAWCQDSIYEMTPEFAFSWLETQLHQFPLYRAWEPKP